MNRVLIIVIAALLLSSLTSDAQAQPLGEDTLRDAASGEVLSIRLGGASAPNAAAIAAKQGPAASARAAINAYAGGFGVSDPPRDLVAFKESVDRLGMSHVRFEQRHEGAPVYGGQIIAHVGKNGAVRSLGGRALKNIRPLAAPRVSAEQASAIAAQIWRDRYGADPRTIEKPKFFIFSRSLLENRAADDARPAWQVELYEEHPLRREFLFIDAASGSHLYTIPGVQDAVSRIIADCSYGDGVCYVDQQEASSGRMIGRSEGMPAVGKIWVPAPFSRAMSDTDDVYNQLGVVHSYYQKKFGRNGANGAGGAGDGIELGAQYTLAYSYADLWALGPFRKFPCNNSMWNGKNWFAFCTGDVIPNTVGHEYNHAVDTFSVSDGQGNRGLIYALQPGALNESFADIFGEALERDIRGTCDWIHDCTLPRSMSNPPSTSDAQGGGPGPYPDKFHSQYYYCGANDEQHDYGGVHHNNGVMNKAAYLMAKGGAFNGCQIGALGEEKTFAVFYRALTEYMIPSTGFNGAYAGIIEACRDLYAESVCTHVLKALKAVEMDQAGRCSGQAEKVPNCGPSTDGCPSDPSKTAPGVCGCGVPDVDFNQNGVKDCIERNNLEQIVPPKPAVKGKRRALIIRMTPLDGIAYYVKLRGPTSAGKIKNKYYVGQTNAGKIPKLISGANYRVSYYYMLDGANRRFSHESPSKRVRVK